MSTDETIHIRFTDAPESYDYGNTSTVCQVGIMPRGINKGNPLRKVAIRSAHSLSYQEPRYQSGLCLCLTLGELVMIQDFLGEIDMEKAMEKNDGLR